MRNDEARTNAAGPGSGNHGEADDAGADGRRNAERHQDQCDPDRGLGLRALMIWRLSGASEPPIGWTMMRLRQICGSGRAPAHTKKAGLDPAAPSVAGVRRVWRRRTAQLDTPFSGGAPGSDRRPIRRLLGDGRRRRDRPGRRRGAFDGCIGCVGRRRIRLVGRRRFRRNGRRSLAAVIGRRSFDRVGGILGLRAFSRADSTAAASISLRPSIAFNASMVSSVNSLLVRPARASAALSKSGSKSGSSPLRALS